jgi:hypothetical protein
MIAPVGVPTFDVTIAVRVTVAPRVACVGDA